MFIKFIFLLFVDNAHRITRILGDSVFGHFSTLCSSPKGIHGSAQPAMYTSLQLALYTEVYKDRDLIVSIYDNIVVLSHCLSTLTLLYTFVLTTGLASLIDATTAMLSHSLRTLTVAYTFVLTTVYVH